MVNPLEEARLRKIAYALKFLAWILITASIFLPWYRVIPGGRDLYFADPTRWLFLIDLGTLMPLVVFSSITGFLSLILSHYGTRLKAEVVLSLASSFTTLAPFMIGIILRIIFPLPDVIYTFTPIPIPIPTFGRYLVILGALTMVLSSAITIYQIPVKGVKKKNVAIALLVGLTLSIAIMDWTSKPENLILDWTGKHENLIEVKTGQKFAIALRSNPSTGYRWQLAKPLNETIIKFINSEYKIISEELGAWQIEIWTFEAVGVGTTEIFMEYLQSWEDAQAVEEQTFTVIIK